MKILITGIDGFIGRAIAMRLREDGHTIAGLSNGACPEGFGEFYRVDITDAAAVRQAVLAAGPELCIHLAAMAHADVGPDKEALVRRVNVDGSIHLIDALIEAGASGIIYFSTVKILGETHGAEGFDENDEPHPEGIYAEAKIEVEKYLRKPLISRSLKAVVVRPVPVIGRGDTKGNYAKMLGMVERGFFPLIGSGEARRSIVFVDTVAERICTIVTRGLIDGRAYVFSDGAFSLAEIVSAMRTATGFAFCPSVDENHVKHLEAAMDPLLSRLKPGTTPVAAARKRFTSSYVVHAHQFEADYGAASAIVLHEKMKETVDWNRRMKKGDASDLKWLRSLDIVLAGTGLCVTAPLLLGAIAMGYLDTGSPIFIQERVGRRQQPFRLIKLRTMKTDTKSVASHLASESSITPFGKFLRKSKLDELPQLINVLKGDMSMVGPRPNLFNQTELIEEREKRGVYNVAPGITGLAQTSGIDMSTPTLLAQTDAEMIRQMSLRTYLRYIVRTASGSGTGDAVKKGGRK